MAVNGVYDSAGYNFGNLASIRKQAEAIKKRVGAETEARIAEQEKTGLIRNPDTGEMVELSSISDEMRERWNHRAEMRTVSPTEAMILLQAADPNAEEVEAAQARGAKFSKIQDKMLAGKKLTGQEKKFLQENYPATAAMADRMEQEAAQLEQKLRGSKTKEGKYQAYIDAKMRIISGVNMSECSDGGMTFLFAALDKAYARHMKGGSASKLDVWA